MRAGPGRAAAGGLALMVALVGCGADGPPIRPADAAQDEETERQPGISITGTAEVGVVGGRTSVRGTRVSSY